MSRTVLERDIMTTQHLTNLCADILLLIIEHLPVPDILTLRLVHSQFRHLCDSKIVWLRILDKLHQPFPSPSYPLKYRSIDELKVLAARSIQLDATWRDKPVRSSRRTNSCNSNSPPRYLTPSTSSPPLPSSSSSHCSSSVFSYPSFPSAMTLLQPNSSVGREMLPRRSPGPVSSRSPSRHDTGTSTNRHGIPSTSLSPSSSSSSPLSSSPSSSTPCRCARTSAPIPPKSTHIMSIDTPITCTAMCRGVLFTAQDRSNGELRCWDDLDTIVRSSVAAATSRQHDDDGRNDSGTEWVYPSVAMDAGASLQTTPVDGRPYRRMVPPVRIVKYTHLLAVEDTTPTSNLGGEHRESGTSAESGFVVAFVGKGALKQKYCGAFRIRATASTPSHHQHPKGLDSSAPTDTTNANGQGTCDRPEAELIFCTEIPSPDSGLELSVLDMDVSSSSVVISVPTTKSIIVYDLLDVERPGKVYAIDVSGVPVWCSRSASKSVQTRVKILSGNRVLVITASSAAIYDLPSSSQPVITDPKLFTPLPEPIPWIACWVSVGRYQTSSMGSGSTSAWSGSTSTWSGSNQDGDPVYVTMVFDDGGVKRYLLSQDDEDDGSGGERRVFPGASGSRFDGTGIGTATIAASSSTASFSIPISESRPTVTRPFELTERPTTHSSSLSEPSRPTTHSSSLSDSSRPVTRPCDLTELWTKKIPASMCPPLTTIQMAGDGWKRAVWVLWRRDVAMWPMHLFGMCLDCTVQGSGGCVHPESPETARGSVDGEEVGSDDDEYVSYSDEEYYEDEEQVGSGGSRDGDHAASAPSVSVSGDDQAGRGSASSSGDERNWSPSSSPSTISETQSSILSYDSRQSWSSYTPPSFPTPLSPPTPTSQLFYTQQPLIPTPSQLFYHPPALPRTPFPFSSHDPFPSTYEPFTAATPFSSGQETISTRDFRALDDASAAPSVGPYLRKVTCCSSTQPRLVFDEAVGRMVIAGPFDASFMVVDYV